MFFHVNTRNGCVQSVAYPELVSRGVSERRKCRPKCLVRVGTSNGVTGPLIKKIMAVGGGFPGNQKTPLDTPMVFPANGIREEPSK